jgi:hypothetical protein
MLFGLWALSLLVGQRLLHFEALCCGSTPHSFLQHAFPTAHPCRSPVPSLGTQALKVIWLLLTGGAKVWHMTATTLSGAMGSVVQTGLDCGDIEYHAIVAKKP